MLTEQLIDYIRQNLAAGFGKEDLQKTMLSAGWSAEDIAAGFAAVANLSAIPAASPAPAQAVSSANSNAAEVARIQAEIARNQARAAKLGPAHTSADPSQKGIIGWLIKKKIVANGQQANLVLIGIFILVVMLIAWIDWPKGSAPTPAQGTLTTPGPGTLPALPASQ